MATKRVQQSKACVRVPTGLVQYSCNLHHLSRSRRDGFARYAQGELAALRAENGRMRRDNERFVRIIDSGEWGRGRVAELVQAGQVLKQERDQLRQLMGHLRCTPEAFCFCFLHARLHTCATRLFQSIALCLRCARRNVELVRRPVWLEHVCLYRAAHRCDSVVVCRCRSDYESVERAKVAQQQELSALKERMKKKGHANNKMLVKARSRHWQRKLAVYLTCLSCW
jgi:hypothetical protein